VLAFARVVISVAKAIKTVMGMLFLQMAPEAGKAQVRDDRRRVIWAASA